MPRTAASARLPIPPTPLVGRQREIGSVCSLLLDAEVRLLTITGPGGVGKTRLAVEAASALVERDPHSVAFVDLAPLGDPELVPATIAHALGVDETRQRLPLDAIATSLGDGRFLLLLDNVEHVRSAGTWLAGLLQRCPRLTALVTSRALLRVQRVSPEGAEEPRFGMLETVREVALERLREAGEEAAARTAHAGWCLALAEQAEAGLRGTEQQPWRDRLEAELENLRGAMAWLLREGRDAGAALRLAGALWYFWYWRGLLSEGRRWLSTARQAAGDEEARGARALLGEGSLAYRQGDYEVAQLRLEESVVRWRALGDAHGLAEALHLLGHLHFDRRDYEAARQQFEASLATYDAPGESLVGLPLVNDLGLVAYHQGRYMEAGEIFEDCLLRFRRQGLKDRVADTLLRLGDLARLGGAAGGRGQAVRGDRGLWLELHGEYGIASSLHKLGLVMRSRSDLSGARALLAESLALQRALGNRQGIAECLAGLAGVTLDAGTPDVAARLLAASSAVLDEVGAPLAPADAVEADRDRALARERLGERAWESACREGRPLPLDEAVATAMAVPVADEPAPAASPGGRGQALSAREREVAVLVARGLTNREIASALHIADKTAANHVEHIMTKLDLRSRTQAAVWAVREGLADPTA